MYWIPKLHKNPVRSQFRIASKNCSVKPLFKAVSNVFNLFIPKYKVSIIKLNSFVITKNTGYSKMLVLSLQILTSKIERGKLNPLEHITLVLCTPHFLMINWLGGCVMLLILFLKVKIEHTFAFPNITFHTEEKNPKVTWLLAKVH